MKGCLLINKMQSQILNPLSVLNCCLYCDMLLNAEYQLVETVSSI